MIDFRNVENVIELHCKRAKLGLSWLELDGVKELKTPLLLSRNRGELSTTVKHEFSRQLVLLRR
jgi:hypothetical protein